MDQLHALSHAKPCGYAFLHSDNAIIQVMCARILTELIGTLGTVVTTAELGSSV